MRATNILSICDFNKIPSWPAASPFWAKLRRQHLVSGVYPFTQKRTSVARIDDLFDPERLRSPERRPKIIKLFLNLCPSGRRIGRSFNLPTIGSLHAAFDRQRPPITRRPRIPKVQTLSIAVSGSGDAEHSSQDDRDPGHCRLIDGGHRPRSVSSGTRALRSSSDQKARLIDKVDDRQMECIAQINKSGHLLAARRIKTAATLLRIAREHTYRIAVEPREHRHKGAAVVSTDLKHRFAIENQPEQPTHIKSQPAVSRDNGYQLLLTAIRIVAL